MAVKILQIGAGIRGRHWAQFVKDHPDTECLGLVEPDAANRDQAKAIIGEACRTFDTLEAGLAGVEADAALIVSPDRLHREQVTACLEAGLTVLVEKPLAPTMEDALAILAKAKETGRQVIVGEQYRFWAAERTVKKLLDDGALGRLDHATVIDRRKQPASSEGPWMKALGYPHLQDIAVHHFDSLRMWFGKPRDIFARAWNTAWSDFQGKCNTEAVLTVGDVRCQYLGTMHSHRFSCGIYIEGEAGALWTNRKYVFRRKGGSRFFLPVRNVKVPKGDEESYPRGGTTALLDSLRDAVKSGQPAETRAEDNIWSIAMLEAGKRSDQERREVAITEVYEGGEA